MGQLIHTKFGWKQAGEIRLHVCEWARVEESELWELSVKDHRVQSVSSHNLYQTFLWKGKGQGGKAGRITPKMGSRRQPKCIRCFPSEATDKQTCLLFYSPWKWSCLQSKACGSHLYHHVKSGYFSDSGEAEQVWSQLYVDEVSVHSTETTEKYDGRMMLHYIVPYCFWSWHLISLFALLGECKDIIFIIKKSIFDKRYLVPGFCMLCLLLTKLFAARTIKD